MPRPLSEACTRKEMINPPLARRLYSGHRVESLQERVAESIQQVERLFESVLSERFGGVLKEALV